MKRLDATLILDFLRDMTSSDFMTIMDVHSSCPSIRVVKLILKQKVVPALVKALNGDDGGSKSLDTLYVDAVALYAQDTEKLSALITASCNFAQDLSSQIASI